MKVYKRNTPEYTCSECFKKSEVLIRFETDNDYYNLWICKECLEKALTLINKEIENV